jgi:hypothetical protein
LLRESWPGAVVLDGDEKDGQIVGAGRSNMLSRICHARAAVRQEDSEPIAWNDQNAYIDVPSLDCTSKVDHVNYEQVAARGHLNLTAHAYPRAVDGATPRPVNVTRRHIPPGLRESFINEPPNRRAAKGF